MCYFSRAASLHCIVFPWHSMHPQEPHGQWSKSFHTCSRRPSCDPCMCIDGICMQQMRSRPHCRTCHGNKSDGRNHSEQSSLHSPNWYRARESSRPHLLPRPRRNPTISGYLSWLCSSHQMHPNLRLQGWQTHCDLHSVSARLHILACIHAKASNFQSGRLTWRSPSSYKNIFGTCPARGPLIAESREPSREFENLSLGYRTDSICQFAATSKQGWRPTDLARQSQCESNELCLCRIAFVSKAGSPPRGLHQGHWWSRSDCREMDHEDTPNKLESFDHSPQVAQHASIHSPETANMHQNYWPCWRFAFVLQDAQSAPQSAFQRILHSLPQHPPASQLLAICARGLHSFLDIRDLCTWIHMHVYIISIYVISYHQIKSLKPNNRTIKQHPRSKVLKVIA